MAVFVKGGPYRFFPDPGLAGHASPVETEVVATAVFKLADEYRDVIGFTGAVRRWAMVFEEPTVAG
ncbi:MAG TPA: hypothetical protein DCP30_07690 [Alistipes sp.]|nr:hypothetical protein [Alistipes onderdonkii]MBD9238177.1 hypothetical protein [Alistipes onderdonkii]HAK86401.1 hypothetical protein [Alistipes sp.]